MRIVFDFPLTISAILILTNLFDAHSEKPGGAEGQWQTRIELACLDGVDRLTGHFEGIGQFGLCPVAFRAQHPETVLHRYRRRPFRRDARNVTVMRINTSETSAFR